jgi:hypothetical protein
MYLVHNTDLVAHKLELAVGVAGDVVDEVADDKFVALGLS